MTTTGQHETGIWAERAQAEIQRFRATGDCRDDATRQAAEVAGDVIGRRLEAAIRFTEWQVAGNFA